MLGQLLQFDGSFRQGGLFGEEQSSVGEDQLEVLDELVLRAIFEGCHLVLQCRQIYLVKIINTHVLLDLFISFRVALAI